MKYVFFFLLISVHLAFASAQVLDGVVGIQVVSAEYDYESPWKPPSPCHFSGSGFVIEGGYILTNAHVVQDQLFIEVKAQNGKTSYADVIAISHAGDLALLQLEKPAILKGIQPLKIRNHMAEINERVNIFGFPSIGKTLCVTEGKVIQTEVNWYVHTLSKLLIHRLDGRAFGGNSGGPVVVDDTVVGVLHQGSSEFQEMIPVPVIQHFLKEVQTGCIEGFPRLHCDFLNFYQPIRNPALRAYYQMGVTEDGILIRYIPENHFLYEKLFPGDIVLSIDGYGITEDQMIKLENGLKVSLKYLVAQKYYGDYLDVMILRDGLRFPLSIYIDPSKKGESLVPRDQLDRPPTYYIHGGLVFQPVDSQFKMNFDEVDYSDRIDYYYYSGKVEDKRTQIVVLTKILPDKVNEGYICYPDIGIVKEVNGQTIRSIEDVIEAFETNHDRYHRILTEADYEIVIDVQLAKNRNKKIMTHYGISADRSLNLQ